MKIHFILSVALLQVSPGHSAGVRHGHLAAEFDQFLARARSNDTYKQCKKNCDREYQQGTTANANCHQDCDYAYEDWNYFPTGGQCKKRCKTSKDCQVGGFNPCGECGEYVGTAMYQLCYAPKPSEEEQTDTQVQETQEENFLENNEGENYSCGMHCHQDSDCWQGGVVECGTCNQIHGTEGYHTCISDSTPAPSPWNYFPEGGQCSKRCKKDSDCQKGGFNPCGSCGQYVGTLMYQRCYAPEPAESTPAPSPAWNYFPDGGQCSKHCKKDSDCQNGGFNPCGSCGKYAGTLMYQRCYAPEPYEQEEIAAAIEALDEVEEEETELVEHNGGNGYSCGMHCHQDSDCWQGGLVECGTCNQIHGTEGYHTCISESTPAPSPWDYFPEGGQCSKRCKKDSDCQKGGFNPCGSCGQYVGTLMYQRCYAPEPTTSSTVLNSIEE